MAAPQFLMNDDLRKKVLGDFQAAKEALGNVNLDLGSVSSALALSRQYDAMRDYRVAFERLDKAMAQSAEARTAGGLVKRVMSQIQEFEAALDLEHEVGIQLVSFGQAVVIHVQNIGYIQPNLVLFAGMTDDKKPMKLIQHMSQLSFLLTAVPRLDPDAKRRPIGFLVPE